MKMITLFDVHLFRIQESEYDFENNKSDSIVNFCILLLHLTWFQFDQSLTCAPDFVYRVLFLPYDEKFRECEF